MFFGTPCTNFRRMKLKIFLKINLGRKFKFQHKSIYLVDTHGHRQLLLDRLLDHPLCVQHHTLRRVDKHAYAVRQAHTGGHLVGEVDVAGSIEYIEKEGFVPDVLADQGYRHGLIKQLS